MSVLDIAFALWAIVTVAAVAGAAWLAMVFARADRREMALRKTP